MFLLSSVIKSCRISRFTDSSCLVRQAWFSDTVHPDKIFNVLNTFVRNEIIQEHTGTSHRTVQAFSIVTDSSCLVRQAWFSDTVHPDKTFNVLNTFVRNEIIQEHTGTSHRTVQAFSIVTDSSCLVRQA
ncbi:hypothetical protein J6590_050494 [Homalodisca vitripennis]|nr:hypothetical protein J6590_050494 [Homalodisca vitripennis]